MNTNEETIVMGADGIDLTSDSFKQPQQEPQAPQSPVVKPIARPVQGNDGQTWKRVAIGGVAGIMVGTAGAAAATVAYHHFFGNDEEAANTEDNAENSENSNSENSEHAYRTLDNGMKVAENIDESLSFKDAFNAAREQVGPDGVFHWHGNVYSTHTEAEWNSMTPQERSEFVHNATPEYSAAAAEQPAHEQAHAAQAHHAANHHEAAATARTASHEGEDNDDVAIHDANNGGDDDVQIVGVEEVTLADGSVATMATTNVQGHEVYMVDIDHDGVFDVAAMDANGNGQLEENELMDISQNGIHVASVNNANTTTPAETMNVSDNNLPDIPAPDMDGEITVEPDLTASATPTAFDDTAMQDYNNDVSGDLLV